MNLMLRKPELDGPEVERVESEPDKVRVEKNKNLERTIDGLDKRVNSLEEHLTNGPNTIWSRMAWGWHQYIMQTLDSHLTRALDERKNRDRDYEARILKSDDEKEIFKNLLLKDLNQLEAYITETRLQASKSFSLAKRASLAAFILLFCAAILAIFSKDHTVAWIPGISGILSQFISGVLFYLYSKATIQFNEFDKRLEDSRKVCISLYLTSLMVEKRDDTRVELIKLLASIPPVDARQPANILSGATVTGGV